MTGCTQPSTETTSDTNTNQNIEETETAVNTDWLIKVYGNDKEFKEAISRYGTNDYYGEIMLQEKQLSPDVLLKYTKSAVMANHGAMKKEYFFTLPDGEIVKVKVALAH